MSSQEKGPERHASRHLVIELYIPFRREIILPAVLVTRSSYVCVERVHQTFFVMNTSVLVVDGVSVAAISHVSRVSLSIPSNRRREDSLVNGHQQEFPASVVVNCVAVVQALTILIGLSDIVETQADCHPDYGVSCPAPGTRGIRHVSAGKFVSRCFI